MLVEPKSLSHRTLMLLDQYNKMLICRRIKECWQLGKTKGLLTSESAKVTNLIEPLCSNRDLAWSSLCH